MSRLQARIDELKKVSDEQAKELCELRKSVEDLRKGTHRLSTAEGWSQTYATRFDGSEDPLSEGGKWSNHSKDWTRIRKKDGIAHGTETGTNTGDKMYDDSFAHLSGFPPDQEAWAVAQIAKPDVSCHQELEILLRWTSSAHSATGYECFARCLSGGSSYLEVVRWNGPLGKFTYLAQKTGPDYGLKHGDTLKASIVGNVITVYVNGVRKVQVTDDTYKTGNPGIGMFLYCDGGHGIGSNSDFGFSSFTARAVAAQPRRSVCAVLPGNAGPIARHAREILGRQIAERCGAQVVNAGPAACAVELGIESGIGTEGYKIVDGAGGSVRILGNDERGLLYGVGRFLRSSRYDRGGFTPGTWRGRSVPKCPMRGIYLATHFNNYYEAASPEELDRYVEDLALWGFNLLALTYPHWQYASYDDPAARG